MTLQVLQSVSALRPGAATTFIATGGTAPYAYAVAGASGATIDSSGAYVAGSTAYGVDTVTATDNLGATATAQVLVGSPLMLLCEILQRGLNLAAGRVYLWNQKIMQPTDAGLYVAVSVPMLKSYGQGKRFNPATQLSEQYVAMQATVDVDVTSRGPEARDGIERVLMVLASDYSDRQQTACGFQIARIPSQIVDLSAVDGAAIPYRYRVTLKMLYAATQSPAAQFYDSFNLQTVVDDGPTATATVDAGSSSGSGGSVIDGGGAL